MKNHEVRELRALAIDLCKDLSERPWAIARLEKLLLGCIDLTRQGKAWQATSIAIETTSQLTTLLSKAKTANVGLKTDQQPWWVSPRVDLNYRPVATTEQMQAAADAAMNDHIGWFVCTGCGKKTATADGKKPLAWVFNAEVDGEVYKALCAPCFGTGILKQYNCRDCDSTTESRVHPAPGWTDVGDGEFICFACAEEEAKP